MEAATPLHVLVIEDDADARANLRDILELDDYHVDTAGTAAEALHGRDWSRYFLIILDRRLPDGTAEEFMPRLQQLAPQAQVIIVTGYADVPSAIAAIRLGAADYILKPINPDELRKRTGNLAERRQFEERLQQLATFPAESPNPILRIAQDGTILYANAASQPVLSLWQCRTGHAVPPDWQKRLKDAAASGINREYELPCGERIFSLLIASIPGASYVNLYGQDITGRKRSEAALRRERDFAESLIETAQAIVLVLDRSGRILRFNGYFEKLTGYRLEEVAGDDWFDTCLPPADRPRVREAFAHTLDDTDAFTNNIHSIVTKAGQQREIQWFNKGLRDADGKVLGILAIGHDITPLRSAQQRALQAERLAAIGQVFAGLAHESRNALQRSQACLEMIARRVKDRPEVLNLIDRLQHAQNHLHQLYEEVRNYSAPIRLQVARVNLGELLAETWEHLAHPREGRDAQLVQSADGVDLQCCADRQRIEQVFRNILENSLNACTDPVIIKAEWSESAVDSRRALRLAVRDNGPGLSPDAREKIFEPFFTTKTQGTGLGMAIVQRIVEAHGGRIAVGADHNAGAEILVTLPREAV